MALRYPAPFLTCYINLPGGGGRFAPEGWPISSGIVAGLLRNMQGYPPAGNLDPTTALASVVSLGSLYNDYRLKHIVRKVTHCKANAETIH